VFALSGTSLAAGAVGTLGTSASGTSPMNLSVCVHVKRLIHHYRQSSQSGRTSASPTANHVAMTPAETYAYWTKARMKAATPAAMGVPGSPKPTTPSELGGSGSCAPGAQLGAPSEGP
jgi:hypothetical protein